MTEEFIKPITVREMPGLSIAALAQLRCHGRGQCYYKPTQKTVLYKHSEVLTWVKASVDARSGYAAIA